MIGRVGHQYQAAPVINGPNPRAVLTARAGVDLRGFVIQSYSDGRNCTLSIISGSQLLELHTLSNTVPPLYYPPSRCQQLTL